MSGPPRCRWGNTIGDTRYEGCDNDATVQNLVVTDAGHGWPLTDNIDEETAWEFLAEHDKAIN